MGTDFCVPGREESERKQDKLSRQWTQRSVPWSTQARRHATTLFRDRIKIASPCDADWNRMQGDDRVRFCAHCQKNVYNLSALTRRDAEALIKEKEGNLCARFYRRADGTVLTQDCPVGLKAKITRRISWLAASAMTLATAWAQDPAMLTGKVVDSRGEALSNAVVEVSHKGTTIKATTDGFGRFRLNPTTPGEYDVKVSKKGFPSAETHLTLANEKQSTVFVTLPYIDYTGSLGQ